LASLHLQRWSPSAAPLLPVSSLPASASLGEVLPAAPWPDVALFEVSADAVSQGAAMSARSVSLVEQPSLQVQTAKACSELALEQAPSRRDRHHWAACLTRSPPLIQFCFEHDE